MAEHFHDCWGEAAQDTELTGMGPQGATDEHALQTFIEELYIVQVMSPSLCTDLE